MAIYWVDRARALVKILDDVDVDDATEGYAGDESIEIDGAEYLVLTEDEANERWDEALDQYLEECIYPELQGSLATYFDSEAWKRDARFDGRGHCLASYDGEEHDSDGFVIFRIN